MVFLLKVKLYAASFNHPFFSLITVVDRVRVPLSFKTDTVALNGTLEMLKRHRATDERITKS